jgi:aconitate hydratase
MAHPDSFGARSRLAVGERDVELFRLDALQERFDVLRLPYTLRILLENVLRNEDGATVTAADVEAVAGWVASAEPSQAISFTPGRVLHQDFTGVPAIVDLAAMRNAMADLGGEAARINPQLPSELVIDHSVQVDEFATPSRSGATRSSSSSATASATPSCAGARAGSTTSRSSRPRPGSCTR